MSRISADAEYKLKHALASETAGKEMADRGSSEKKVAAFSTSATISTDTAFIAKLKVGDVIVSHKAAANENATVVTDGTLPAGITDAAGVTMAWRSAANPA